jgi:hypothetical protein
MYVILENESQAIKAAKIFIYKHVAGAAANFEISDRKVVS